MKLRLDLDKALASFILAVTILGASSLFTPATASASTSGTHFDHIVVIAFENHPYNSIIGSGSDPFITSLLPNSAVLDMNSYPSSPSISGCSAGCYTAVTSGNSYSVSDGVSSGSVNQANIFDRLTGAGLSWAAYCENGCPRSGDHFSCLQYSDTYQSSSCVTLSGPLVGDSQVLGTFNSASPPSLIWLTPDDTDNMHNTSVGTGDSWLLSFLVGSGTLANPASGSLLSTGLFTNPSDRTLLLLWFDECSSSCGSAGPFSNNDKAEIYYGGMVNKGLVDTTTQFTDYNTLRTIEDNWGLTCLSNACNPTADIADLFGSTSSSLSDSFTFSPSTPTTVTPITFTGSATGGSSPYVYSWSFGDGSTGSGASVSHTYSTSAKYTVGLNVTDSSSKTATTSQTITVNNPTPPSVSFTYSPTSPIANSGVSFSATPTGGKSPYTFSWNFGDGVTSTGASATHTYSAAGTYSVNVTVTDANSLRGTSSQRVTVSTPPPPDFSISASPSALGVQAGQVSTSMITLSSINGYSANVSLVSGVNPTGPSVGLSASGLNLVSGASASSTLTISTSVSTPSGVYYVTVNATGGSSFHTVKVSITVSAVPPPDFSYSASPAQLTLEPGQTGQSTILFSSVNSFSGTIMLTQTGSSGLSLSLSAPSVTLSSGVSQSVVLTVGALSSASAGSYSALVTATGGTAQHSVTVTILVTLNAPPSVSVPGSQTVTPGSAVVFVVNSSDVDGETVALTVYGLPSDASFDLSTGKFSWTPSSSEVGTYNVTFTGTDNGSPAESTSKSVLISVRSASVQPPPSQSKNQGGVCLRCIFTGGTLTPLWLVAVGAATGALLGIGVIYLRARAGLRNARRMRRLTRRY